MEEFKVTVVGQDLFGPVKDILCSTIEGANTINTVNHGMLGNLKALTYSLVFDANDIIRIRKAFMNEVSREEKHMLGLYMHGDWMHVFILKPIASRLKQGM